MPRSFKVKGETLLKKKIKIKSRFIHNAIRMQTYTILRKVFDNDK